MGVTTYYSASGELLGHRTDVGAAYGTDALGSVTVTAIENQQRTPTNYYYKPYGSRLNKLGNNADPRYLWNGTSGYRETAISHSKSYVQARHLGQEEGRWTTVDPVSVVSGYAYAALNPVSYYDFSGLEVTSVGKCNQDINSYCNALRRILDPKSGMRNKISKCIGSSRETLDPIFDYLRDACSKGGKKICLFCSATPPPNWPEKQCGKYCESGHEKGTGQTIIPTPNPVGPPKGIPLPIQRGKPDTEPSFCYSPPRPSWANDCIEALQNAYKPFDFGSCDCIAAICRRNDNEQSQWTLYHELTHCSGIEGAIRHGLGKDLPYRLACCICRAIDEGENQFEKCRLACQGVPTF